jgi:hypothetical protein
MANRIADENTCLNFIESCKKSGFTADEMYQALAFTRGDLDRITVDVSRCDLFVDMKFENPLPYFKKRLDEYAQNKCAWSTILCKYRAVWFIGHPNACHVIDRLWNPLCYNIGNSNDTFEALCRMYNTKRINVVHSKHHSEQGFVSNTSPLYIGGTYKSSDYNNEDDGDVSPRYDSTDVVHNPFSTQPKIGEPYYTPRALVTLILCEYDASPPCYGLPQIPEFYRQVAELK